MVDIIAEEKGLPKETVLDVIEQAIAAAWRKDNGDREMRVVFRDGALCLRERTVAFRVIIR